MTDPLPDTQQARPINVTISNLRFRDLWTLDGTIDRLAYLVVGLVAFAIKSIMDQLVAIRFSHQWNLYNYLFPGRFFDVREAARDDRQFYFTLLTLALPFIWIGVTLTFKRLRSARLPLVMTLLFFIPFINLQFFLLLCLYPEHSARKVRGSTPAANSLPDVDSEGNSLENYFTLLGLVGSSAGAMATLAVTWLGVNVFKDYGWGLFLAAPFFQGMICSLINQWNGCRSINSNTKVAFASLVLLVVGVLAVAVEGIVCMLMAAPIWIPIMLLGVRVGTSMRSEAINRGYSILLLALTTPLLMGAEHMAAFVLPTYVVKTVIEIDAPPAQVWSRVTSFHELPEPEGWLFKTGIAYPMRAEIDGRGVGAVRHCVFSTGAFVEPIEIWDEPRLLRFAVTSQPPALKEWSPYKNLAPAHLDGYFKTSRGQFLLTPLPGNRTRLEGSTWYTLQIHPQFYWKLQSDWIIHRIHLRVLEHIKERSEAPQASAPDAPQVSAQ